MKFKIFAVAVASASLAVAQASAADIPAPEYRAPVQVVAPAFNWTGFYAGFNVGYGFGKAEAFGASENLNGLIAGGQIGGNWQTGALVLGLEADFQGSW